MELSILADPKFGWLFVWGEITIFYLIFCYIHRRVEEKRGRSPSK